MSSKAPALDRHCAPAPKALSDRTRRRGLNALLVYTFFMVAGFSMLMPLVAVHFVSNVGMAATLVGLALAIRQLTQQGLAMAGGMLSDRFGTRAMIGLGVLLRAAGFASLAFADNAPLLFASMMISALGGALFEAPYQAAIAELTTEQTRSRYYALSNWVSGVATTIGPLLGVLLLRFDFQWVCLVASACFALNFVIALQLPGVQPIDMAPRPLSHGIGLVARDKPFLLLTSLMMGYWFAAVQVNISFPLMAERLTGSQDSVGLMFAVSAALTVALQYVLVRWLERWFTTPQILILGAVIMSLGCGAIGFVNRFDTFMLCVATFSVGTLLARPTQQTLIASMAHPRALGTFLGVSSLSLAVGGAVGNFAGGWLMDWGRSTGSPRLPWFLFCGLGLCSAAGLFLLDMWRQRATDVTSPDSR